MKVIPSFNIGYSSKELGRKSLTLFPVCFGEMPIREFTDAIRQQVQTIYGYAKHYNIPPSHMCLYINLSMGANEWDFHVMMKNVREYKEMINQGKQAKRSIATETE